MSTKGVIIMQNKERSIPLTSMRMTDYQLLTTGFIFSILLLLYIFVLPGIVTRDRLDTAVKIAKTKDLQTGYCFDESPEILDWWDNPICINRKLTSDKTAVIYVAFSLGKDSHFDPENDYYVTKKDVNNFKVAGKFLAHGAKNLAAGARDGLFSKSKFEDADGKSEIGEEDKPTEPSKVSWWKFWQKD
jgi:hypothetical protein